MKRQNNTKHSTKDYSVDEEKKINYSDEDIIKIMKEIGTNDENNRQMTIRNVALKYKINYSTLKFRYKKFISNTKITNHGGNNKLFTDDEEQKIYDKINNDFIKKNLYFDDECLKILAMNYWNTIHENEEKIVTISNGWVYDFKIKWRLSTLRCSYTRIATTDTAEETKVFLETCQKKFKEIPHERIFNMDETHWKLEMNKYVIGLTGSENRKVINNFPKYGMTAVFVISADGKFMKPIILATGESDRCLQNENLNFENNDKLQFTYTKNGWIDDETMILVLINIANVTNSQPSVLILDSFRTHQTQYVKDYATAFKIELIFVPAGKTMMHQPLDVGINGPIKSKSKRIIKEILMENPSARLTFQTSLIALVKSIPSITEELVIKSFKKALLIT